jgi:hypothetical protein
VRRWETGEGAERVERAEETATPDTVPPWAGLDMVCLLSAGPLTAVKHCLGGWETPAYAD